MTVKIDTDADINSVRLKESAAPATPASGYGQLYAKSDGKVYFKNDAGLEIDLTLTGTAGSGYTEGARIYLSTGTSIDNNTLTSISFDSELYDTDNIHSGSSSQLYCNTAGKYIISAHVAWGASVTGERVLAIRLNGTTYIGITTNPGFNEEHYQSVCTIYDLSIGNYIEAVVRQESGGPLIVPSVSQYSPHFMMQRIG